MTQKRIGLYEKMMRRSSVSLLAVSLLVSSCSSAQYASEKVGMPDERDTRIDPSAEPQRNLSQMLATVSNSDRERCERFAKSEADSIEDNRGSAVFAAIVGSLIFAKGAPFAFVLFGLPTIAAHTSEYSQAHAAAHDRAIRECLDPVVVEAKLGADHPDVAASLSVLAARYRAAQKYSEAEELYRRVIAIQEKALVTENSQVADSLEAYATVLSRMDRLSEAEAVVIRYQELRARIKSGQAGNKQGAEATQDQDHRKSRRAGEQTP